MGLKIGLIGMAALGVLCGWLYIQVQAKELIIAAKDSKIQVLTTELEVVEGNLATAETANKLQSDQVEKFQQQIIKISAEREESRKQVEYVRNLFQGHDFRMLLEKKPGLIEKRMIKATAKVLGELEEATQ